MERYRGEVIRETRPMSVSHELAVGTVFTAARPLESAIYVASDGSLESGLKVKMIGPLPLGTLEAYPELFDDVIVPREAVKLNLIG